MILKFTMDDIDLFNNVYSDYMKNKRRLGNLDDRIALHTNNLNIQYDRNDVPLSKLKYRVSEVREDYNALMNRHRHHRGSMNNIPVNFGNAPEFAPIQRNGRSSLIPFKMSMGSNVSLNGPGSEKAQRRSDLLKDFGSLNRESNMFKNSNLDFGQMLDFF